MGKYQTLPFWLAFFLVSLNLCHRRVWLLCTVMTLHLFLVAFPFRRLHPRMLKLVSPSHLFRFFKNMTNHTTDWYVFCLALFLHFYHFFFLFALLGRSHIPLVEWKLSRSLAYNNNWESELRKSSKSAPRKISTSDQANLQATTPLKTKKHRKEENHVVSPRRKAEAVEAAKEGPHGGRWGRFGFQAEDARPTEGREGSHSEDEKEVIFSPFSFLSVTTARSRAGHQGVSEKKWWGGRRGALVQTQKWNEVTLCELRLQSKSKIALLFLVPFFFLYYFLWYVSLFKKKPMPILHPSKGIPFRVVFVNLKGSWSREDVRIDLLSLYIYIYICIWMCGYALLCSECVCLWREI